MAPKSPFVTSILILLTLLRPALAADGSDRVDNGDGTWSFAAPSGLRVGDHRVDGTLTWEYIGQAVHSYEPEMLSGKQWVAPVKETRAVGGTQALDRVRRIYDDGTEWVVASVDTDGLRSLVRDYDERNPEASITDEEDVRLDEEMDGESEDIDEEGYDWTPNGWTTKVCTGLTYHIFNSDDRAQLSSLTDRQRTAVLITHVVGSDISFCDGVLLDGDSVLTAAHCVVDADDNALSPYDINVCTLGNAYSGADCHLHASSVDISTSWSGGWDPASDWAVIDVGPAFSGAVTMAVSAASDANVTPISMHNIAFPLDAPSTPTCVSGATTPVDSDGPMANFEVHTEASMAAPVLVSTFQFSHDGGEGHSGSPIYYCGDDHCDTGEQGVVVSIWSGWNGFDTTQVGAKIHNFRTAILALL